MTYHIPVMLNECLEGLNIHPQGTYVDVTFGGGGHSMAILERLNEKGRLFVFDQDIHAKDNLPSDSRITFIHSNYRHLYKFLRLHKAIPVDGILADFGVSSHQIDTPDRGFSIRFDGQLDMRMDTTSPLSAWEVINTYSREQLTAIFFKYGEIDNARRLSSAIKEAIEVNGSIDSTSKLSEVALPLSKGKGVKYLAQVFQALRIEVNDEIKAIEEFLEQTPLSLKSGGRLVIMSYHSLEDRPVKNFMKYGITKGIPAKDLYGRYDCPWKLITKKPIEAKPEEIDQNPRSRSAKLRIAEKI
ncbi:MAG: 16S rRNA (cytosine(1402)-N(4))-methyltransferase RsmH [Chitinophagales bacterium]|nr:16S rRNA (cytosine(1402)-N(4))-methyltransferase RsmH [Chitinophagales bacterium]